MPYFEPEQKALVRIISVDGCTSPNWVSTKGPIGTFLTIWVPIFIKGAYFPRFRLMYAKPVCLEFVFNL